MQLVDQENGWTLFEDDKTFPDGVVVIARYVLYGSLKVDVVNTNQSNLQNNQTDADDLTSLCELKANKSSRCCADITLYFCLNSQSINQLIKWMPFDLISCYLGVLVLLPVGSIRFWETAHLPLP